MIDRGRERECRWVDRANHFLSVRAVFGIIGYSCVPRRGYRERLPSTARATFPLPALSLFFSFLHGKGRERRERHDSGRRLARLCHSVFDANHKSLRRRIAGRVGSIAIAIARRTTLSPAAPRARWERRKKKTKEKKKMESMHFSSIGVSGPRPSRRRRRRRLDSPE